MTRSGEPGPRDGAGGAEAADGRHRWYLSGPMWAKLLTGFSAATLVVVAVLGLRSEAPAPAPAVSLLLGVGLLVAACTTAAIYLGVRRDLGLPARTALYAVGYNALVVAAKFVVAPRGIYRLNEEVPLESFVPFTEPLGAVVTALGVLLLYLGAFTLIYAYFRRQVATGGKVRLRDRLRRRRVTLLVVGVVLLAGGGSTVAFIGLGVAVGGGAYLEYVFTSAVSLVVGLAVAGATTVAVLAFRDVRDRVRVVGDASVIVGFFWLGLFALVLYHALWVVFILVLAAVWPLKVVIPK